MTKVLALLAASTLMVGGCSTTIPQTVALRGNWPQGLAPAAEVAGVPFYPQQGKWCGPASLAAVLNHATLPATPESLAEQVFVPGLGGSLTVEMMAAARRAGAIAYPLRPQLTDLLHEIAAGHPVLVLQNNGFGLVSAWHYAVVVGYDYPAGELYLRSGSSPRLALPFTLFEVTWRASNYWSMVVLPPDRLPATANEANMLAALLAMEQSLAASRAPDHPHAAGDPLEVGYRSFLRRWPGSEVPYAALANSRYAKGDLAEAEALLREGLRHLPASVVLRNNLAQTLIDQRRCDDAQWEIRQLPTTAGELGRFEADVKDTIGNLDKMRQSGRCTEANTRLTTRQ